MYTNNNNNTNNKAQYWEVLSNLAKTTFSNLSKIIIQVTYNFQTRLPLKKLKKEYQ